MKLTNKEEAISDIRKMARKQKISVLEACLLYCEQNEIELEAFATFVRSTRGKPLHKLLQKDGLKLNLLKK